jgi:hypothetical protein
MPRAAACPLVVQGCNSADIVAPSSKCIVLLCAAVLQDVSGGLPVQVQGMGGVDLSLYGMQIDLEQARSELRAAMAGGGASGMFASGQVVQLSLGPKPKVFVAEPSHLHGHG